MGRSGEIRALRRAAGLCTACGRRPAVLGRLTCESCAARRREREAATIARDPEFLDRCNARKAALREQRKAAGLCTHCGSPTDGRHVLCDACRARSAESRRNKIASGGVCARCLAPLPQGWEGHTCQKCRDAARSDAERRKAVGMCVRCGREMAVPGIIHCPACREHVRRKAAARGNDRQNARMRHLRAERRAAGLCTKCGGTPAPGKVMCEKCLRPMRDRVAALKQEPGHCSSCGAALPAGCRTYTCPTCRRSKRLLYARRKAAGLCPDCGAPVPNKRGTRCAQCVARRRESIHQAKAALRAQGKCIECGRRPADGGFASCHICREQSARRHRERMLERVARRKTA